MSSEELKSLIADRKKAVWRRSFLQRAVNVWLKELLSALTVSCRGWWWRGWSTMDSSSPNILFSPTKVTYSRGHPRMHLCTSFSILSLFLSVPSPLTAALLKRVDGTTPLEKKTRNTHHKKNMKRPGCDNEEGVASRKLVYGCVHWFDCRK